MRWSKSDSSNILAVLHYVGDSVYGEEIRDYVKSKNLILLQRIKHLKIRKKQGLSQKNPCFFIYYCYSFLFKNIHFKLGEE